MLANSNITGEKRERHMKYKRCCMEIIKQAIDSFVQEELALREQGIKGAKDGKKKASEFLKIPLRTIQDMEKRDVLPAKVAKHPVLQMPKEDLDKVRPAVISLINQGVYPTVSLILEELKETHATWSWSRSEVYRALKVLHFSYINRAEYYYMYLRNQPFNLAQRWAYLRQHDAYKKEKRPIFYMDESWINKNIMPSHGCTDGSAATIPRTPAGKGARWILIGAGGPAGWIPGTYEMFVGKKKNKGKRAKLGEEPDDYHSEMNGDKFKLWLHTKLLPSVPENAVLVLDRASYHREMVESSRGAQKAWRKGELIEWLQDNHGYTADQLKGKIKNDIFKICQKHKPEPVYKAQIWVQEWNAAHSTDIKILYLPVAYPEFNPIEHVWCSLKQYVAKNNITHEMKTIEGLALDYIAKEGAKSWENAMSMTENYIEFNFGSQLAIVPSSGSLVEGEEICDDVPNDSEEDSDEDESSDDE